MKVFLSWSGTTSHKVACAFREWIPSVIQSIVPYVSSEDIDKGARWSTDIAKELEDSRYGIVCVTKENLNAPWVNFEAGALSKIIEKSFVTPFLFDLKRSDVQGPLLQFQSTVFEKDDILKLLKSINNRSLEPEKLTDEKLAKAFEVWWPQLGENLKALKGADDEPAKAPGKTKDKTPEILEELLELSRTQQRLIANPTSLLPPDYLTQIVEAATIKTRRMSRDREAMSRIHDCVLRLERILRAVEPESPLIVEARDLVDVLHGAFHEFEEWPESRFPFEDERKRRRKVPTEKST